MGSKYQHAIVAFVGAAALVAGPLQAADPPSGEVSETNPEVNWTVEFKPPTADASCGGPSNPACDNFLLTITPPSFSFQVEIIITPFGLDDWDLEVYDPSGNVAGSSGNPPGSTEVVILTNPEEGVWTVAAAPFAPLTNGMGTARIVPVDDDGGGGGGEVPEFVNYGPPGASEPSFAPSTGEQGIGLGAGEPSIGIPVANNIKLQTEGLPPDFPDPEPNLTRAMYIALLETLRLTWDDCTDPAPALWEDKSVPSHITSLDPILETDQLSDPSRTHSLQLFAKRSLYSFSDDDGENWEESVTGGGINSGVDHQTVGMGPFPALSPCPVPLHPTATYYASQDVALAQMAISCDGGLTFETANPMWTLAECGGLHGHIQVAPDGTAFVPNKNCGGEQGMGVTTDGTLTSTVKTVPGSTPSRDDPAIGIGQDPGDADDEYTVYFGFSNGDGHPMIAWSDDAGDTWSAPVDVGAPFGIQNSAFGTVVAGDRDRAAFAFMGSATGGDGTAADPDWPGIWHLYVAVTYDRGQTWGVEIVTPGDPVQRGAICQQGTTCESNRNLLDFMDIQKDEKGRISIAWADGCVGGCVNNPPNSGTDVARASRQLQGARGLLAAFDDHFVPPAPVVPKSPYVEAARFPGAVELAWSEPFDGGDAIVDYQIFRQEDSGAFVFLTSVPFGTNSFQDATVVEGVDYAYQVLAANGEGASDACFEAPAVAPPVVNPCTLPGVQVLTDAAGDQVGGPALDIQTLHIAEPAIDDGAGGSEQKVVFTLKVGDGATAVSGNAWIIMWARQHPDPSGPGGQVFDRNMVNMRMTAVGPECHFGKITAPSVNQGVDFVTLPSEDCELKPDGTITIAPDTAVLEDCDPPGSCVIGPDYEISGLELRVFQSNLDGQPVTQAASQDSANGLSYTLFGNDFCLLPDLEFVPTALTVDAVRNGVFEAGESAVVAPGWGNVSGSAGPLTGSGEAFFGPGDSTYTIEDGAADYGSIEAGAQASCEATGDCYTLSLSMPSVRPARHWDTTFDELLSTGAEKSWILHIGDSFADVAGTSPFYPFIETIFHHGITVGCTSADYCPAASTSRRQMPVFVLKALEGSDFVPADCQEGSEQFSDVPASSPFCRWIEELVARQVVAGCGSGKYCPANPVTRAQMAIFTLKTLEGGAFQPPACESGSEMFGDVPASSGFCPWIEELARRGVVFGCGGGNYCPANPVTRGQMAVFISKTFGLSLYGP